MKLSLFLFSLSNENSKIQIFSNCFHSLGVCKRHEYELIFFLNFRLYTDIAGRNFRRGLL